MPIDMEKLNEAILGERGYYDMLLKTEKERKSVLRFNLQAFKNNELRLHIWQYVCVEHRVQYQDL